MTQRIREKKEERVEALKRPSLPSLTKRGGESSGKKRKKGISVPILMK